MGYGTLLTLSTTFFSPGIVASCMCAVGATVNPTRYFPKKHHIKSVARNRVNETIAAKVKIRRHTPSLYFMCGSHSEYSHHQCQNLPANPHSSSPSRDR